MKSPICNYRSTRTTTAVWADGRPNRFFNNLRLIISFSRRFGRFVPGALLAVLSGRGHIVGHGLRGWLLFLLFGISIVHFLVVLTLFGVLLLLGFSLCVWQPRVRKRCLKCNQGWQKGLATRQLRTSCFSSRSSSLKMSLFSDGSANRTFEAVRVLFSRWWWWSTIACTWFDVIFFQMARERWEKQTDQILECCCLEERKNALNWKYFRSVVRRLMILPFSVLLQYKTRRWSTGDAAAGRPVWINESWK